MTILAKHPPCQPFALVGGSSLHQELEGPAQGDRLGNQNNRELQRSEEIREPAFKDGAEKLVASRY